MRLEGIGGGGEIAGEVFEMDTRSGMENTRLYDKGRGDEGGDEDEGGGI